jgi:hypothetical protein
MNNKNKKNYTNIILIVILLLFCLCIFQNFQHKKIGKYTISNKKKYNVGILCSIKNEEMIIKEWIDHYIWQGVQHFYIIDNESNDRTKEILQYYINNNIVSYYYLTGRQQEINYNKIFNEYVKNNCEWLLICDADEYIYNRNPQKNIQSYIEELPNKENVNGIELNWKMFGSSGFVVQPKSIRKSFTMRQNKINENTKQIVKTDNVTLLHIHKHDFKENKSIIKPTELALNHYAIMSNEYFEKVKMTRGDVSTYDKKINNIRNWKYFEKYDHKEVFDNELANIIY